MRKLLINKQINDCLTDLSAEEYRLLEASCMADGILDPIIVWEGTDFIVDGHNRYNLAIKYELEFEVVEVPFDCIEDVILWVHRHQLGRRNIYGAAASLARSNIAQSMRDSKTQTVSEQQKIARQLGVNVRTVQRDTLASGSLAKLPSDIRNRITGSSIVASQKDLVTLGTLDQTEINLVADKLRANPALGLHEVMPKKNNAPKLKESDIALIDEHFDRSVRLAIHSGSLPVTSSEIAKVMALSDVDRLSVFDIIVANKEVKSITQALSCIDKPAARDIATEIKKKKEVAVAMAEKLQLFADDIATLKDISNDKWHTQVIEDIKSVIEQFRIA